MAKFITTLTATSIVVANLALNTVAPATAGHPSGFSKEVQNAHNLYRLEAGVPLLSWSPKLAANAQRWANKLAKTGRMRHSSLRGRQHNGENIAWYGISANLTPTDYVNMWASEKKYFVPGIPFSNKSAKTGNWSDVSHYSQIIWRQTTKVGCGMAMGKRYKIFVCRYNPMGNKLGQMPR